MSPIFLIFILLNVQLITPLEILHRTEDMVLYTKSTFQEFRISTKIQEIWNFDSIKELITFVEGLKTQLNQEPLAYLHSIAADLLTRLKHILKLNSKVELVSDLRQLPHVECEIGYQSFDDRDMKRYVDYLLRKRKEYEGKVLDASMDEKARDKLEQYLSGYITNADKIISDLTLSNRIRYNLMNGHIPQEIKPLIYRDECWKYPEYNAFLTLHSSCVNQPVDKSGKSVFACNVKIRIDDNPTLFHKFISPPFSNISLEPTYLYSLPEYPNQLYELDCGKNNEQICDLTPFNPQCSDALRSRTIADIEYYCTFRHEPQLMPMFENGNVINFDKECAMEYEDKNTTKTINGTDRTYPLLLMGGTTLTLTCPQGTYVYHTQSEDIEISDFVLSYDDQARLADLIYESYLYYSIVTSITVLFSGVLGLSLFANYKLKKKLSGGDIENQTSKPIIKKKRKQENNDKKA